jgi:methyl-accepting chemotaxis protein
VFGWLSRDPSAVAGAEPAASNASQQRLVTNVLYGLRSKVGQSVSQLSQLTGDEVAAATSLLQEVVDRSRAFVQHRQLAFAKFDGRVGRMIGMQGSMLRDEVRSMAGRAAEQDERARQAAAAAKTIADLAQAIERLASEARLLAVNARIESSRLGAQSAGFEVLASEMQRLSDEVAGTNERVSELAARLGTDLPWIAQHARDLRGAMESFAVSAAERLEQTESGVQLLKQELETASRFGGIVMEEILKASHGALSHLQFQDTVAAELRGLDAKLQEAQAEIAQSMGGDAFGLAQPAWDDPALQQVKTPLTAQR